MSTHLLPNRFEYSAIKPHMNNCEADSMYETFLLWLRNPVKLSSNNNSGGCLAQGFRVGGPRNYRKFHLSINCIWG